MARNPKPERKKIVGWRFRKNSRPAVRMSKKEIAQYLRREEQSAKNRGMDWAKPSRNSVKKRRQKPVGLRAIDWAKAQYPGDLSAIQAKFLFSRLKD